MYLQAGERQPDGEKRGRGHFAVVFAESGADSAFAGPKGINAEYDVAELRGPDAPRLHHRVLLRPAPVAVDLENCREFALLVRQVEVRGHADAGPRLKGDLLNAVAVAFEFAVVLRVERAGFAREPTPRGEQVLAKLRVAEGPFFESRGWLVVGPHRRGLLLDEVEVFLAGRRRRIGGSK